MNLRREQAHMVISSMTKKQIQSPGNTPYDDVLSFIVFEFDGWSIWTHEQKVWFLTSKRFKQSIKIFSTSLFILFRKIEPEYFNFFIKKLIQSMDTLYIKELVKNENLSSKIIQWITPKQARLAFFSIHSSNLQHLTPRQIRHLKNYQKEKLEKLKLQASLSVDNIRDEFDSLTTPEKTRLSLEHIENLSPDQKQKLVPTFNSITLSELSSKTLDQIFDSLNINQRQWLPVRQIKNLNSKQKADIAKDLSSHQIYLLFLINPSILIDMLEHFSIGQFATAFPLLLLLESEIGDLAKQKIRQTIQTFPMNIFIRYYHPMMLPFLNTVQKSLIGESHHRAIDLYKGIYNLLDTEITFNSEGFITDVNDINKFLRILNHNLLINLDHLFGQLSIEVKQSLTVEQIERLSDKNKLLLIKDLTKDQIQSLDDMFFANNPIIPILALEEGGDSMTQRYDYLDPQQREWLTSDQQYWVNEYRILPQQQNTD